MGTIFAVWTGLPGPYPHSPRVIRMHFLHLGLRKNYKTTGWQELLSQSKAHISYSADLLSGPGGRCPPSPATGGGVAWEFFKLKGARVYAVGLRPKPSPKGLQTLKS